MRDAAEVNFDLQAELAMANQIIERHRKALLSRGMIYRRLWIAARSELAALREELAHQQCQVRSWKSGHEVLKQRLTAAEQRNAELTKAIADAEYRADQGKVWNGMGWTYTGLHSHGQQKVLDILRAALKPTESDSAPEGATHRYLAASTDRQWRKLVDGVWCEFCDGKWLAVDHPMDTDYLEIQPTESGASE